MGSYSAGRAARLPGTSALAALKVVVLVCVGVMCGGAGASAEGGGAASGGMCSHGSARRLTVSGVADHEYSFYAADQTSGTVTDEQGDTWGTMDTVMVDGFAAFHLEALTALSRDSTDWRPTAPYTVATWVKWNPSDAADRVLMYCSGSGATLPLMVDSGFDELGSWFPPFTGIGYDIQTAEFMFIAISVDSGGSMYYAGSLDPTDTPATVVGSNSFSGGAGNQECGWGRGSFAHPPGWINSAHSFTRALSDAEVVDVYYATLPSGALVGSCDDRNCARCRASDLDFCLECGSGYSLTAVGTCVSPTWDLHVEDHDDIGSCEAGLVPVATVRPLGLSVAHDPEVSMTLHSAWSDPPSLPLPFVMSGTALRLRKEVDEGTYRFTVTAVDGWLSQTWDLWGIVTCPADAAEAEGDPTVQVSVAMEGFTADQFVGGSEADDNVAALTDAVSRALGISSSRVTFEGATDASGDAAVDLSVTLAPALWSQGDVRVHLTVAAGSVAARGLAYRSLAFTHSGRLLSRSLDICCTAIVVAPQWSSLQAMTTDTSDLHIWWSLVDGSGGTAADWSDTGLDGVITTDGAWDDDGVTFSGDDWVVSSEDWGLVGDAELTLMCWFYWTDSDFSGVSYPGLIGMSYESPTPASGEVIMLAVTSGMPIADFVACHIVGDYDLEVGKWTHVAYTKTSGPVSSTSAMYVNGAAVPTSNSGSDCTPNLRSGSFVAGTSGVGDSSRSARARLNDARVYGRALSADEVAVIYDLTKSLH